MEDFSANWISQILFFLVVNLVAFKNFFHLEISHQFASIK